MTALAFAGLACLIFAFAEPQSPPPPPPTPTATRQEQQEVRGDENGQSAPSNTTFQIATAPIYQQTLSPTAQASETTSSKVGKESFFDYNALMVTIFTGVTAGVAWLQWRVMRRQIAYIRLDQRAWVAVTNIALEPPILGHQFVANIAVKNTGKTFARNLKISCFTRIAPKELIMNFSQIVEQNEALAEDRSVGVLAPGATYGAGASGAGTVTQDSFDRFQAGEKIYIFGRITYDDVFGRPHWTTYCSALERGDAASSVFREYNAIDDDNPN